VVEARDADVLRSELAVVKRYRDIAGDGGSNIAGQVEAQHARLARNLADVGAVVAVMSGKGGVGKSSLTANLACAWALDGRRVGVLDADLNGPSMAKILGVRGQRLAIRDGAVDPAVSALGIRTVSIDLLLPADDAPLRWHTTTQTEAHTWRGTMEANAVREFLADTRWGDLDVLAVDLPPGVDRLATLTGLVAVAGIVIVTIPSEVSHLVVKRSITAARETAVPVIGLVENMAGLFSGPPGADLAREAGIPFLGAVPFDEELARAGDRGEAFVRSHEARDAARSIREIATRITAGLSPERRP
jgi:ATP-binding protein involved in chromosome partitioning